MKRLIVCGIESFDDYDAVYSAILNVFEQEPIKILNSDEGENSRVVRYCSGVGN